MICSPLPPSPWIGKKKQKKKESKLRKREMKKKKTYREHQWNTTPHSLGAVELRGIGEPEFLATGAVLPANDGSAVEKDVDALPRGERGRDARVVG